ncbi:hypothetical protein LAZ67_11002708 [Cordylochernes scorpioides]|uniref:Uncharacterized protein n=1 Tax=Cordylochernes scorpioides TaxID=51811 RepID=A0ABY6KZF1_9ARAC|nr:hypothetical protein LAZ67_11002708 [Cordylochernes scorpioides]
MHNIVLDDSRVKVCEMAEAVGISEERVRGILHKELGRQKLFTSLVLPHTCAERFIFPPLFLSHDDDCYVRSHGLNGNGPCCLIEVESSGCSSNFISKFQGSSITPADTFLPIDRLFYQLGFNTYLNLFFLLIPSTRDNHGHDDHGG